MMTAITILFLVAEVRYYPVFLFVLLLTYLYDENENNHGNDDYRR